MTWEMREWCMCVFCVCMDGCTEDGCEYWRRRWGVGMRGGLRDCVYVWMGQEEEE